MANGRHVATGSAVAILCVLWLTSRAAWAQANPDLAVEQAAQSAVLLVDGKPAAYLSRDGKQLRLFVSGTDPLRSLKLRAIAERLREIASPPVARALLLSQVDDGPIALHPIANFLREAGFQQRAEGFYLPPSARLQEPAPPQAAPSPEDAGVPAQPDLKPEQAAPPPAASSDEAAPGASGSSEAETPMEATEDDLGFSDVPASASGASSAHAALADASATWRTQALIRTRVGTRLETSDPSRLGSARASMDLKARYRAGIFEAGAGVHAEYDPAYTWSDRFDQATVDEYQHQLYLIDSYLTITTDHLDFSVGRLITVWGENDVLSPLDVVNAKDQREPGLAELEDLRLPSLMSQLTVRSGYFRFALTLVHESNFGFRSPPRGPFSSFQALSAAAGLTPPPVPEGASFGFRHVQERFALDQQQFFARAYYQGPSLDLALYFASALDQFGTVSNIRAQVGAEVDSPVTGAPPEPPPPQLQQLSALLNHRRYELLGASIAVPVGAWVLRAETRANFRLNLQTLPQPGMIGTQRFTVVGGAAGVAYAGFSQARIVLELSKDWVLADEPKLWMPVEAPVFSLRMVRTFLQETLTLEALGMAYGWRFERGGLVRVEASYNAGDGWTVALGAITYQPTKQVSMISGFTRHDQVYVKLRVAL